MSFYGESSFNCVSFIVVVVLVMVFGSGIVESDSRLLRLCNKQQYNGAICSKTIIVDQLGNGNFLTIQSAIDSVPSYNDQWICIHVKSGVYREKVMISLDKPFIVLEGEGKENTVIEWGDSQPKLNETPTFTSYADNFVARQISFKNTYNPGGNPRVPAVAAMIFGNKSSFYGCGFFGLQDTLWDAQGLHYFKDCYIEGAVDFIFGMGQSMYENCTISVIADHLDPTMELQGYITAQGRESPEATNGFVFKHCDVLGKGKAYLGRAWRSYSRVLFYESTFSDVVYPIGWDAWNFTGHEDLFSYTEYRCTGPGSNMSQRVQWINKLSPQMLKTLSEMTFIDNEGWIDQQP